MLHEKPLPPKEMPLLMLVNEIAKLFRDRMRLEGEKVGMQSGFRHLLFHLVKQDGITQLELAQTSHLSPPTISVSLQKMEQEGLVIRKPDPADMRQIRVYLTEKGRKLDEAVASKLQETEHVFLEDITSEELLALKQLLIRIRSNALTERRNRMR